MLNVACAAEITAQHDGSKIPVLVHWHWQVLSEHKHTSTQAHTSHLHMEARSSFQIKAKLPQANPFGIMWNGKHEPHE